jgi:DNA polymerase-3 subunit delta'
MEGFASIVGQERAVARLRGAIASGKPHHAYLFDGPDGVGKRATALAFAQALSCERRPGEGCGACEPCRKLDAGIHPDLIAFEVLPEKGQTERVRELLPRLAYAPNEARARVVLIDPAHELNDAAANVLLKTLEEPPAGTHFVLCSSMAAGLLTTIRSRCQRVAFGPLDQATIAQRLAAAHGLAAAVAAEAAALSGGSIGRALELAASEELPRRRERAARLVEAARARRAQGILDAAAELAGDREEAEATIDLLWATYRDAVLLAEGLAEGRVAEGRRELAGALAAVPTTQLTTGLHALEEAREAVLGYVSPQLAFEQLLFHIARAGAAG